MWDAVAEGVAGLILGTPELAAQWIPTGHARRGLDIDTPGQAITPSRSQHIAEAAGDCRGGVLVDGAAHAPNMSHPDEVNTALREFLADI